MQDVQIQTLVVYTQLIYKTGVVLLLPVSAGQVAVFSSRMINYHAMNIFSFKIDSPDVSQQYCGWNCLSVTLT